MKLAICENNKETLENVYEKVLQYQFREEAKIDRYSSGEMLMQAVTSSIHKPYDIIIMDICLTDLNGLPEAPDGIAIVKKIKDIAPSCLVIYISSYDVFYSDLAQAEPFAFLHKPITQKALFEALDNCQTRLNRMRYKYYIYRFREKDVRINLNDVVFFQSQLRSVHIHLNDGSEKYFYSKLDAVENQLKGMDAFFLRINKSHIINKIYIEEAFPHQVIVSGQELNVTEKYQEAYNIYLVSERYF